MYCNNNFYLVTWSIGENQRLKANTWNNWIYIKTGELLTKFTLRKLSLNWLYVHTHAGLLIACLCWPFCCLLRVFQLKFEYSNLNYSNSTIPNALISTTNFILKFWNTFFVCNKYFEYLSTYLRYLVFWKFREYSVQILNFLGYEDGFLVNTENFLN